MQRWPHGPQVGSGKSSILAALLGELLPLHQGGEPDSGPILRGSIGYCQQVRKPESSMDGVIPLPPVGCMVFESVHLIATCIIRFQHFRNQCSVSTCMCDCLWGAGGEA